MPKYQKLNISEMNLQITFSQNRIDNDQGGFSTTNFFKAKLIGQIQSQAIGSAFVRWVNCF